MKKLLIAGIITASTAATAWLIYLALTPGRGRPAAAEAAAPAQQIVRVAYRPQTLALDRDAFSPPTWKELPIAAIPLKHQVTAIPWGKATVPEVRVRAFHNGKQIYIRFEWEDDTENRQVAQNSFSDACAVMFPLNGDPRPESIMMGFLEPANIWSWKAARDAKVWGAPAPPEKAYSDYYYPFVEEEVYAVALDPVASAVEDLVANRIGTTTPKSDQRVRGRGLWDENRWTVVFERELNLEGSDLDARIPRGAARTVAFAVWNGAKGDRGARKSISDWVRLEVAP
jgi:hypothetical protein